MKPSSRKALLTTFQYLTMIAIVFAALVMGVAALRLGVSYGIQDAEKTMGSHRYMLSGDAEVVDAFHRTPGLTLGSCPVCGEPEIVSVDRAAPICKRCRWQEKDKENNGG